MSYLFPGHDKQFPTFMPPFYDRKMFYGVTLPKFPSLIWRLKNYFLTEKIASINYQSYSSVKGYFFPALSKFDQFVPVMDLIIQEIRIIAINYLNFIRVIPLHFPSWSNTFAE